VIQKHVLPEDGKLVAPSRRQRRLIESETRAKLVEPPENFASSAKFPPLDDFKEVPSNLREGKKGISSTLILCPALTCSQLARYASTNFLQFFLIAAPRAIPETSS